jgi:hypothetical protein
VFYTGGVAGSEDELFEKGKSDNEDGSSGNEDELFEKGRSDSDEGKDAFTP